MRKKYKIIYFKVNKLIINEKNEAPKVIRLIENK